MQRMPSVASGLRIVVAGSQFAPLRLGLPPYLEPGAVRQSPQSRTAVEEAQPGFEQRLLAVLPVLAVAPPWFVVDIGPCSIL